MMLPQMCSIPLLSAPQLPFSDAACQTAQSSQRTGLL